MKQAKEGFIKLKNQVIECESFDIIQSVIIAKITSWQREGRQFFQSKEELAKEFKVDRKTISRRMKELEDMGVIYREGKVKRSSIYKVNPHKLHLYLSGTNLELNVPEGYKSSEICTSSTHYNNNNKNSNKTIFIGEEDVSSSSSPTEKDLEAFAGTLSDIDIK